MLKSILKIPFNYLGRYLNLPLMLPMSISFAVTHKCNSRCKTCNIWQNDFKGGELNLLEIESFFRSLGRSFVWVTLSGGEPFLREDLTDICQIIYRNCQPAIINIPTNGTAPEKIIEDVSRIVKDCNKAKIIINLSIDGIGEKHDGIRGVPGNFENIIKTHEGLKNLKNSRLRLGFYSIISSYNIDDWENILSLSRKLLPDSHFFEIAQIRDEFKNEHLDHIVPLRDDCTSILRKLHDIKDENKKNFLECTIHSLRKNYYLLTERTLAFKKQIIPCFAGFASAHILPDGKVWACSSCARVMGDLKDFKFDFKKLWHSQNARNTRGKIKKERCSCLQVNTNYLNLFHSPLYLHKLIYDYLF